MRSVQPFIKTVDATGLIIVRAIEIVARISEPFRSFPFTVGATETIVWTGTGTAVVWAATRTTIVRTVAWTTITAATTEVIIRRPTEVVGIGLFAICLAKLTSLPIEILKRRSLLALEQEEQHRDH